MADFPEKLDEEMWEMHKLKMVELHGLPCGGVGAREGGGSGGGGKGPYREDYLDSAREMYSEGENKTSKDAGTMVESTIAEEELEGTEMYVPVDEYGVPLLEPIIEASKESMISGQNSQGAVAGDMPKPSPPAKKPPKKAGSNRALVMHKATKSKVRTLETLEEVIQDGFGIQNGREVFKGSKSWELVNAEIARSKQESSRKKTGKHADHWPVPDGKKYKDVRKHNWTQTDEDKDLSTIRGIHSTIENITSELSTASSTLEKVKFEVRNGQRESLEHELKAAHHKYKKQAQWEVDKIHRKLEAQRLAQNSLVENAVLASKRTLQSEWEEKLKAVQEPLNDEIEGLRLQVKDKSKRIIELENEIDMVKQDRTHIEQKFNNLRLELEMGTYSPLVTKLREELSSERNQNEYMRNLVTNLEQDLEDVKQAKRDALAELEAAKEMIVLLKSESRGLKRELVQRVTKVEEVSAAEIATITSQKARVEAELDSSREDFKRQVGLMDIMNAQHKEIVTKYEEEIDVLEARVKQEQDRMVAFMQKYNVPGLFRSLSVTASSRKMASRTGVTDLVAALEKLNQGLEGVVAGIPEAIQLIEPLRSAPSSRRQTAGTGRGSPGGPDTPRPPRRTEQSPPRVFRVSQEDDSGESGASRGFVPEIDPLRTPRSQQSRPREHSPLKPMPSGRDQGQQDGREEGPVMGRTLHLPNIHRIGVGMSGDPGDKARRQLGELGDVAAYIDDYQRDLRQSMDEAMEQKQSTPPLLKPGEPSPRARTHRLILNADGAHRGPADYHVHASEHPPPSIFEQVTVDVFQPIPEVQEESSGTEIWASKS